MRKNDEATSRQKKQKKLFKHGVEVHPSTVVEVSNVRVSQLCYAFVLTGILCKQMHNGPFAAGGHMVHAGGQAAHWDIQNKENSNLS